MSVTCLQITDARWVDFISGHPEATIFHHPAWVGLLVECYGYRPLLLAVLDAAGEIVAGLPFVEVDSWLTGSRVVALPFSDFCPPLAVNDAVLDELIQGLQIWRRQQDRPRAEVRWPLLDQSQVYPGEAVVRHMTCLVPDAEQVAGCFKGSVLRCIRQAEKAGVIIKWGRTWDDLRLFYGLHLLTRRRLGTPVQPLRFFQFLWKRLVSQGLGFVLLAYKDSQLLAGAVFLHWKRVLVYKYGASNPVYWHLRPNNLLFWDAIRWGCQHGYRLFDWGKTNPENEGLRQFKRSWGSDERLLRYSVLGDHPPAASAKRYGYRFLAPVIRRSPPWVCRALGELLYRHFG